MPERLYVYFDPSGTPIAVKEPERLAALDRFVDVGIYERIGQATIRTSVEILESIGGKERKWTPRKA